MITLDSTTQRFPSDLQPEPDVCCLHTTEGMTWPGYSGGGEAPHATIRAVPGKGIIVRSHIPPTQYAKALMNLPGGVETNRRGVLQYELVGTCDPKHKDDPNWYYWPDADDVVIAALADYLRPILVRFVIPFRGPAFLPYPASYGSVHGQRFTFAEWNAFQGICGHQHVPENDHGDPGAFPIGRLIAALKNTPTGKDGFDMAELTDLTRIVNTAIEALKNDVQFKKDIAKFVAEGWPTGPEGQKKVLAGWLVGIDQAVQLDATRDAENVSKVLSAMGVQASPTQVEEAMRKVWDEKVSSVQTVVEVKQ